MESTLGFAGQMVSVTKTQLCHYRVKAATGHMHTNGCGYVSIKLYVQAREEVQIWLEVCSLPTLVEIFARLCVNSQPSHGREAVTQSCILIFSSAMNE